MTVYVISRGWGGNGVFLCKQASALNAGKKGLLTIDGSQAAKIAMMLLVSFMISVIR